MKIEIVTLTSAYPFKFLNKIRLSKLMSISDVLPGCFATNAGLTAIVRYIKELLAYYLQQSYPSKYEGIAHMNSLSFR